MLNYIIDVLIHSEATFTSGLSGPGVAVKIVTPTHSLLPVKCLQTGQNWTCWELELVHKACLGPG